MKPTMTLKLATCAVAVIGLSGCQSMLGKLGFNPASSSRSAVAQTVGEPDLVAGQEALRAGNIGQAIISFRLAMLDPASQADANNGLGIAYARLGRADLAERYFLKAGELAPRSEKYAANLVRFYESDLARTAQAKALRVQQAELAKIDRAAKTAAVEAPVRTARRGPITIRSRPSEDNVSSSPQLANSQRKTARGVINIVQRDTSASESITPVLANHTATSAANTAPMVIGSRRAAQYPVKIPLEPKNETDTEEPAAAVERIALASRSVARSKTIRPAYPVRIELKPSRNAR